MNDKGLEDRGDDLSLDHPNTHPGPLSLFFNFFFFYLRPQRAKQGSQAGPSVLARVSCRLASPRLVSFLLDLGKLPKLDLGVLANYEYPGSSHAGQFVRHSRFTPSSPRAVTFAILAPNNHRTPTPAHISFYATRGRLSRAYPLLRLTSIPSITALLLSGLPASPASQAVGTESLSGLTTRPEPTGLLSIIAPSRQTHSDWTPLCLSRRLSLLGTVLECQAGRRSYFPCTAG